MWRNLILFFGLLIGALGAFMAFKAGGVLNKMFKGAESSVAELGGEEAVEWDDAHQLEEEGAEVISEKNPETGEPETGLMESNGDVHAIEPTVDAMEGFNTTVETLSAANEMHATPLPDATISGAMPGAPTDLEEGDTAETADGEPHEITIVE